MSDKIEVKIEIIAKVDREDWRELLSGELELQLHETFPEFEDVFVKKKVIK